MKTIKFLLFLFVLIITKIFAQIEYDYSGYILNIPTYQYKEFEFSTPLFSTGYKTDNFSNLTRIRFRPVLYIWNGARINIEYESNITIRDQGESSFQISESLLPSTQILDLNWQPVNSGSFSVRHFIDRLYFKQSFDFGNIIVGRQRIAWGTGRIWNPTDLFNPINPINFSKIEKDGADAITSKFIFGDFTDLQLVFNPNKLIRKSNYAFRFRSNFNEFDFSFLAGVMNNRTLTGFDFAGNLLKAGVRGEFLYSVNKANSSDSFVKYILGIDYQFTQKLYGLIEYQFNGEGKSDKSSYELSRLYKGEIINLGQNYIAISSSYEYTPLLKFTAITNLNIDDGSGYISLDANYSIDDDVYLSAAFQITHGRGFSEYYYFPHSFYLKMEYYF